MRKGTCQKNLLVIFSRSGRDATTGLDGRSKRLEKTEGQLRNGETVAITAGWRGKSTQTQHGWGKKVKGTVKASIPRGLHNAARNVRKNAVRGSKKNECLVWINQDPEEGTTRQRKNTYWHAKIAVPIGARRK